MIALGTSYVTEPWTPLPVTDWVPFIQATMLIVVVANLLFYNLYGYLLKYYTATLSLFCRVYVSAPCGTIGLSILRGDLRSLTLCFLYGGVHWIGYLLS